MKLNTLLLLLIIPCLFNPANAMSNINLFTSDVSFTNNTHHKVNINTTLTTTDNNFTQGRDWQGGFATLNPYETKSVLWFSRNKNLKSGQVYQYNLAVSKPDTNDVIQFRMLEKGNAVFGSSISTSTTMPSQTPHELFNKSDFEHIKDDLGQSPFSIYAKTWRQTSHAFNSFHFVIDEPVNPAYDTQSSQNISVLTYNIQMMPFYAGAVDDLNQPHIRAFDLPAKISQFDVVILEELFDKALRDTIIKGMSAHYPYHTNVTGHDTTKPLTGGVMIFSKWPITNEKQMTYRACAGADCLAAKGAIYSAINKNGTTFHVIGTHLQAGSSGNDVQARTTQLSELTSFSAQINTPNNQPLIFAGDFNIDFFGKEFSSLTNILNVHLPDNSGHPYSYDGSINCMAIDKDRSRIDFIFYGNQHRRPKTALNNVFILRDIENKQMWPKFDLSDHFPVAAYFDFSTEPE